MAKVIVFTWQGPSGPQFAAFQDTDPNIAATVGGGVIGIAAAAADGQQTTIAMTSYTLAD